MNKKLSRRIAEAVVEEIYPLAHNDARENLTAHFEPIIAAELPDGAEAASELLEVAQRYEAWETKLLLNDSSWQTRDGLPIFTQELVDEWIEIQTLRNQAIAKAKNA